MDKPTTWMGAGALALFVGVGYMYDGTTGPLGIVAVIAGAGMLLFGLIAQAVKLGVRSARD